jgi:hypothetical protein
MIWKKQKHPSDFQAGYDAGVLFAATAIIPDSPWTPDGGWAKWAEDCILSWQKHGTTPTAEYIIKKRSRTSAL